VGFCGLDMLCSLIRSSKPRSARFCSTKPLRLTIFGPPGGGKGTQSAKITRDFRIPVVSTGELLRHAVAAGTPLGKQVQAIMASGKLVDDVTMVDVVRTEIEKTNSFVMDGYPRNLNQAATFDKMLSDVGKPLMLALFIQVSQDVILERLANRRIHLPSGRIYHLTYNPPKVVGFDDVTGEALVQREDDREETILRRLREYDTNTAPLLDYYQKTGILKVVESPNSDVGYVRMLEILNSFIKGN